VTRDDLLDRSIVQYRPVIERAKRRDEEAFWQAFEAAQPRILGALLEVLSVALRNLPSTRLDELLRWSGAADAGGRRTGAGHMVGGAPWTAPSGTGDPDLVRTSSC
jgi:hypothetical protein